MTTTETMTDWQDVDGCARTFVANWRAFECFCWDRKFDRNDVDEFAIFHTVHRDSGLLAQANHKVMARTLAPWIDGDEGDVLEEHFGHPLVKYIDAYAIRVYQSGSDHVVTDAFRAYCGLRVRLEDYPILDEDLYSEMENAATLENLESEAKGIVREDAPPEWLYLLYSAINAKDPNALESTDDLGGWMARDSLMPYLRDLGLLDPEYDDPDEDAA